MSGVGREEKTFLRHPSKQKMVPVTWGAGPFESASWSVGAHFGWLLNSFVCYDRCLKMEKKYLKNGDLVMGTASPTVSATSHLCLLNFTENEFACMPSPLFSGEDKEKFHFSQRRGRDTLFFIKLV